MATRYRLPEALGGEEYEEYRHVDGGTEAPAGTVAFLLDGCIFTVARGLLVEVKPPLPKEPPVGTVVRALLPDEDEPWVFERGATGTQFWHTTGGDAEVAYDWEELNRRDTPIRLVPDPFAEPVELPWRAHVGQHTNVTVSVAGINEIGLHVLSGGRSMLPDISAEEARYIARALWAAADQAERAS